MLSWLSTRKTGRRSTGFRPRLEALDGREVPATLTWTGNYDNNFLDQRNWVENALPHRGDELIFGPSGGSRGCDNLTSFIGSGGEESPPYTFSAVRLQTGYTGTVTLASPFDTGTLELQSGAIATSPPPYGGGGVIPSYDISVVNSFTWTGGVLNSSDVHSTLHMLGGSTASITPAESKTLITGSTLSFENSSTTTGSIGTFNPGTIQFSNGANIVIAEYCQMRTPQPGVNIRRTDIRGGNVYVRGTVEEAGNIDSDGGLSIEGGGTVTITGARTAKFMGKLPTDLPPPSGQFVPSVHQASGLLSIQGGSTLQTGFGYVMQNGELRTTANPYPFGKQTATINPGAEVVAIRGGFIDINQASYGELLITGKLVWTGGQYIATVSAGPAHSADLLHCTGQLEVGGMASIRIDVMDEPPGGIVGQAWKIIQADGGTLRAAGTPSVAADWGLSWEDDKDGVIRKKPPM